MAIDEVNYFVLVCYQRQVQHLVNQTGPISRAHPFLQEEAVSQLRIIVIDPGLHIKSK